MWILRTETQVVRLSRKYSYQLSHMASPVFPFLTATILFGSNLLFVCPRGVAGVAIMVSR